MFHLPKIAVQTVENGFLIGVCREEGTVPYPEYVARNAVELTDIVIELMQAERVRLVEWAKTQTFGDGSR